MDYHEIGQRIREERSKFNLTQEKFAEIIDMSTIYVGQIERGERRMSLDTLIKVSDSLHVSLDYLIRGSSQTNIPKDDTELNEILSRCSKKEIGIITDIAKTVLPYIKP